MPLACSHHGSSCIFPFLCIPHHLCSIHACCPVLEIIVLSKVTIAIVFEAQGHQIQTAAMCSQAAMIALRKRGGLLACMCGWGLLM